MSLYIVLNVFNAFMYLFNLFTLNYNKVWLLLVFRLIAKVTVFRSPTDLCILPLYVLFLVSFVFLLLQNHLPLGDN